MSSWYLEKEHVTKASRPASWALSEGRKQCPFYSGLGAKGHFLKLRRDLKFILRLPAKHLVKILVKRVS